MVNQNKLYSLDDETLAYIETIPKNKRSKTVRDALKLHKLQHGIKNNEKITENKKIGVRIIA